MPIILSSTDSCSDSFILSAYSCAPKDMKLKIREITSVLISQTEGSRFPVLWLEVRSDDSKAVIEPSIL